MKLYDEAEIRYIVEEFLADYLHLDSVILTQKSIVKIEEICNRCGIEVENITENNN